jgi:cytidylate kinase
MPDGTFVVAIDGPSAAGKTTIGTLVAERLGATFLDSGVLYRVIALLGLEAGLDPADAKGLATIGHDLNVQVREASVEDGRACDILVGSRDVTRAIRSPEVDAHVSQVASHPEVREAIRPLQRSVAHAPRVVVVGRDIGTVIFPDAELKIYLDASPAERARRRAGEVGAGADTATIQTALERRDALDRGREVAPLIAARDAVVIDTDGQSIQEVAEQILALAETRGVRRG